MNIEEAIRIAATAHDGQHDKGGKPYILHPIRVMLQLSDEDDQIVAVLHDVVEDTDVTLDYLKQLGLKPDIIDAIDCMTHRDNESYKEYLKRVKSNPISKRVKLADITDNMSPNRMYMLDKPTRMRLEKKYRKGLVELVS
jgi:(p)ppGpp synthase/HD superfamily hydrolase